MRRSSAEVAVPQKRPNKRGIAANKQRKKNCVILGVNPRQNDEKKRVLKAAVLNTAGRDQPGQIESCLDSD